MIRRVAWGFVIAITVAWVIAHVMSIYTEAVNWDELAMLNRTESTRILGEMRGGGRPGLAVIALLPFVASCTETIATITAARLLWAGITLALLAGLFVFLLRALRDSPWRWHAAALGTASLALVPVFMRWSLQIAETDQPAIAAAIWGSVFALASRSRPRLALAAGGLIALGYLFSQKAIYVGALATAVALGDLFRDGAFDWRRELKRIAFAVAGLVVVMLAYRVILSFFMRPPETASLGGQLDSFANYRKVFGLRLYRSMLPSLYPHLALLGLIAVSTLHAYRHKTEHRRPNLIALAVAALGVVIGWFHAAAFPYFWCTLGLFPATAIALGLPGLAAMLRRSARPVLLLASAWLLWIAIPYHRELFMDSQEIQRRSFAFIEHDLPPNLRGFSPDGGLFCRNDPDPFRQYFREDAEALSQGPDAAQRQDALIAEFRRRPVAYVLETFLLDSFPSKIREFWARHYVRYAGTVSVAGQTIAGAANTAGAFDVIVPGEYRWYGDTPISVADKLVPPGGTVTLAVGIATVALPQDTRPAVLSLALPGAPRDKKRAFHSIVQIVEIIGARTDW